MSVMVCGLGLNTGSMVFQVERLLAGAEVEELVDAAHVGLGGLEFFIYLDRAAVVPARLVELLAHLEHDSCEVERLRGIRIDLERADEIAPRGGEIAEVDGPLRAPEEVLESVRLRSLALRE